MKKTNLMEIEALLESLGIAVSLVIQKTMKSDAVKYK